MSKPPILFYGDPHGEWEPLRDWCAYGPGPGHVVIVGDLELSRPLHEELAELFAAGWTVSYVIGNHDTDTCQAFRWLVGDHPTGDLSNRVVDVGGVRIAGLSGLFKQRIWLPPSLPLYVGRRHWLVRNAPLKWGGGVPLHLRDTIWPEDVQALGHLQADVLASHEGPTSVWQDMGHSEIDRLAHRMRCRLIVHGHHHHSGVSTLPNGVAVKSLAKTEVWQLPEELNL